MQEKIIQFEDLSLNFTKDGNSWSLSLPKSQTRIKDVRQMDLLKEPSNHFAPVTVEEKEDVFLFTMTVDKEKKSWEQILKLNRNEKLRLLCNIAGLEHFLSRRITFFLHPDNLVFDDNLMPIVIYRGIKNLVPPFEINETAFLKQYKCFIIALFSDKYNYDQLYNGSLKNAKDTEFQRQVSEINDLNQLEEFLMESYQNEQKKTEKTMTLVPMKRFSLFKNLAIYMIVLSVLLSAPLLYYVFVKSPYQDNLLEAHSQYLSSDFGNVITTLREEDPENLPIQTKYILAQSYINLENLSDREKEVILRNVSLKSDPNYLVYWIFNGRGEFEESIEKAKYIDDPQLIMYGLIKQIEEAKNNPDLTGTERDEVVNELQDELKQYQEDYNLGTEAEETDQMIDSESTDAEIENTEEEATKKEDKEESKNKDKK